MKAKIIITPKKAVLDPQGKTVQSALEHMGYKGVGAVHVGKYLEIELNRDDKDSARRELEDRCGRRAALCLARFGSGAEPDARVPRCAVCGVRRRVKKGPSNGATNIEGALR